MSSRHEESTGQGQCIVRSNDLVLQYKHDTCRRKPEPSFRYCSTHVRYPATQKRINTDMITLVLDVVYPKQQQTVSIWTYRRGIARLEMQAKRSIIFLHPAYLHFGSHMKRDVQAGRVCDGHSPNVRHPVASALDSCSSSDSRLRKAGAIVSAMSRSSSSKSSMWAPLSWASWS